MEKKYLIVLILLISLISGCEEPLFSKQINIREVFDVEENFGIKDSAEQVLTGNIETIIFDDFENNKVEYFHFLRTKNNFYKLIYKDNNLLGSFKNVEVKGVVKDNDIFVESIEGNRDTPYESTKVFNDQWNGIVGEQNYLAIVLRSPDQQLPINLNEKINNLSQFLNARFMGLSNNRMFFSIDYYGVVDVPQVDMQDANLELLFSPEELDEMNISNYEGVMFFGDYLGAYASLRTYNPDGSINRYGNTYISLINIDNDLFGNGTVIAHELGHTFGLMHSGWLRCGNYPNREILGNICRYFPYWDPYSIMGSGYLTGKDYNLRNLLEVLKWVDQENVPVVNRGTYFISPLNTPLISDEIKGLKIPLIWDTSDVTVFFDTSADPDSYYGENYSLESFGTNFYYIEYKTNIFSFNYELGDYGEMHKGILIRLGSNRTMRDCNIVGEYCSKMQENLLLSMHPNYQYCDYTNDPPYCLDLGQDYAFLEEGETYLDKYNKMNITVIETNESGALVKISDYFSCGDGEIQFLNSYGVNEECDDGNIINTDACTNECKLAKANDGICWEGHERCGECCSPPYEDCGPCDDCVGSRGSIASCPENKICLNYNPNDGSPRPSCAVACSSNLPAGCYYQECPREYEGITGYEVDSTDPLAFACYALDPNQEPHYETWSCCEYNPH